MIEIRAYVVMDHLVASVHHIPVRAEHEMGMPRSPISLGYRAYPLLRTDDLSNVKAVVDDLLKRSDRKAQESGGWSLLV